MKDINELRSEYESTYLAYHKGDDYLSFKMWLKKVKKLPSKNIAREHTNPVLQELLNEITPEEMEETRKKMNSLTVAAFRDWWEQAIGLNSGAKQDCFCTCRDEITKLLENESQSI